MKMVNYPCPPSLGRVTATAVLLLVLSLAGSSGCGSSSAVNGGPEDPAIRVVEKLGGQCRRAVYFADTIHRAWLQEVVGDPVVYVDLQNLHRKHVNDQILRELAPLKELRQLILSYAEVTDAGMKHLTPLRNLQDLGLFHTGVTDSGLQELTALRGLVELDLGDTQVTDAGMRHVATLPALTTLRLNWTQISDEGLRALSVLPALKQLHLRDTPVTDAGVVYLTCHHSLEILQLTGTKISASAWKELAKLRQVEDSLPRQRQFNVVRQINVARRTRIETSSATVRYLAGRRPG